MKPFLLSLVLAGGLRAEGHWWKSPHLWSEVALVAATALDSASSMHQPEANPLLATSGHFSGRGMSIKFGVVGAGLVMQHYTLRKAPQMRGTYYLMNTAIAGATAGTAIYNWREIGGGR